MSLTRKQGNAFRALRLAAISKRRVSLSELTTRYLQLVTSGLAESHPAWQLFWELANSQLLESECQQLKAGVAIEANNGRGWSMSLEQVVREGLGA
jgi:hypothetical protein